MDGSNSETRCRVFLEKDGRKVNPNDRRRFRKRMAGLFAIMSMLIFIVGCGDKNVDMVKNGTLTSHPEGKIGPVFDSFFDSPSWKSEERSGKQYVLFTGKIKKKTHDRMTELAISQPWRTACLIKPVSLIELYRKEEFSKRGRTLKTDRQIDDLAKEMEKEILAEICPVGESAEFEFLLFPGGEIEITQFGNDSWAKLEMPLKHVLHMIYE